MGLINEQELQKKITQVVFKDLERIENKINIFFNKQYALEEQLKALEEKMTNKQFDEFDYADLQNDERKLEMLIESEDGKKCELCGNKLEEEELDLVNGDWLCRECEEELNRESKEE